MHSALPRGATAAAGSNAERESPTQRAAASAASDVSCRSLISHLSCLSAEGHPRSQRHCYLSGTLFLSAGSRHAAPSISELQLVPAQHLELHSWVRGAFGMVQVVAIEIHSGQRCKLVELSVDGRPSLTVTGNHRIVTAIRGRRTTTALAERLQPGGQILCSSWQGESTPAAPPAVPVVLRGVRTCTHAADVVLVRFQPDEPVEAFDLSSTILSKGHVPLRRGRRRHRHALDADVVSIPDTEYDGW